MAYRRPEPLAAGHALDEFSCGESSLDDWLRRHARGAMTAGSARVFASTDDGSRVVGFYALAASTVAPRDATERALRGQPAERAVPAVLLARLAVDRHHQGHGLGTSLLQDALLRVAGAGQEIGVRVVLVHALGERQRGWYQRFGFESSPTDPLHMILLMKDLLKLVSEFESADKPAAGSGASPATRRLFVNALERPDRTPSDAELAAAPWIGVSTRERGIALWNLLLLADRLPSPERGSALSFPGIPRRPSSAAGGYVR